MPEKVKLTIEDKIFELPVVEGTEGERGIVITKLRQETGYITLDPGFASTGSCQSAITFIDGDKGILRYRGYPIEQLAEKASFVEAAYLLINGNLPSRNELSRYSQAFTKNANLHEDMKKFFGGYPATGHPMAMLSAMICALSVYYPELIKPDPKPEEIELSAIELMAKVRTIVACTYKKTVGEPFMYAREELEYVANFLHMLFSTPSHEYTIDKTVVNTLRVLFLLHADHEQNCSTSTVRMVGSSWANMFASVSAGVCALWGPLHGGANQKVVEMLETILADGGNIDKYIEMAKNPNSKFRLMGFGHRVYKNYDPRAKIIKKETHALLHTLNRPDPLLDLAVKLEEKALKDDYFAERKLYPNVDFYSGLIYKAIGIPTPMFPVMFAIGRLPGWIAHWKEMIENPETRIARPRQIYNGSNQRDYIPIEER